MLIVNLLWCIIIKNGCGGCRMSIEEKLVQDFLALPDDKKLEVIDFVEFLKNRSEKHLESLMDEIIVDNSYALKELAK